MVNHKGWQDAGLVELSGSLCKLSDVGSAALVLGHVLGSPVKLSGRSTQPIEEMSAYSLLYELLQDGWGIIRADSKRQRSRAEDYKFGGQKRFYYRVTNEKFKLFASYTHCLLKFSRVDGGPGVLVKHFETDSYYVRLLGGTVAERRPRRVVNPRLVFGEDAWIEDESVFVPPLLQRSHSDGGNVVVQDGSSSDGSSSDGHSDGEQLFKSSSSSSSDSDSSVASGPRAAPAPAASDRQGRYYIRHWASAGADGYQAICRKHANRCSKSLQLSRVGGSHDNCVMVLRHWCILGNAVECDSKDGHCKEVAKQCMNDFRSGSLDVDEVCRNWVALGPCCVGH